MAQHQLFIMRHGQAAPGQPGTDFDRPLTTHGQLQAQAIGDWLTREKLQPAHIIASAALRARQTAELVCDQLSQGPVMSIQANLYQATMSDLITLTRQNPEECFSLMVVGHNPTLEDYLFNLVAPKSPIALRLKPGSIAVIEVETSWTTLNHVHCSLLQLTHANALL